MDVLVAGGTGVIGRPLVEALTRRGHNVTAIVRSTARAEAATRFGVEAVVADVLDRDLLERALGEHSFDALVDELTTLPDRLSPRKLGKIYAANNRLRWEGGGNLLAAAAERGVRRAAIQSSAYWYRPGEGPADEATAFWTDAPGPIGTAAGVMRDVEQRALHIPGIGAVLMRYGTFYGPGTWYAPDGDIGRRLHKRSYPIIADSGGVTSFIELHDAAEATVLALESAPPGAYNLVDDEPATAQRWLPELARACGAPSPRTVPRFLARLAIGGPLLEWTTDQRGASNAKLRRFTTWKPHTPSWRQGFTHLSQAGRAA